VQKFTRPLTREIEMAGERLALTLSAEGISVRPVGARKPPHEMSWTALLCLLTGPGAGHTPSTEEMAAAVAQLKKGKAKPAAAPAAATGAAEPAAAEHPATTPALAPATAEPAPGAEKTTSPGKMDKLLERLEKWLAKHRRHFLEGLRPGASAAELDQLQSAIGRPLPDSLRTLLAWHNGQGDDFPGRFEQDWNLMSTDRIAEVKRELDAEREGGWQPDWIPFLDDDAGDHLCLDAGRPGAPVREFWQGRSDHAILAPSLEAWLEDFLKAAEAGAYHEDPERGSFLRSQSGQH
jgi:cell wall assembly regulator SMI1